ncbi:hypothetical protein SAMD00023353_3800670 [Rosellinia necatrix]|uniref:Uncharacterized protein n=1 Tax=Rosellinia necatrix TaxID=77044 RepID=A0A1S8A9J8_ROSNE|nr:hypothetical protein SAMD00023353_3800670 [Rosellinia necatrix]
MLVIGVVLEEHTPSCGCVEEQRMSRIDIIAFGIPSPLERRIKASVDVPLQRRDQGRQQRHEDGNLVSVQGHVRHVTRSVRVVVGQFVHRGEDVCLHGRVIRGKIGRDIRKTAVFSPAFLQEVGYIPLERVVSPTPGRELEEVCPVDAIRRMDDKRSTPTQRGQAYIELAFILIDGFPNRA